VERTARYEAAAVANHLMETHDLGWWIRQPDKQRNKQTEMHVCKRLDVCCLCMFI